MSTTPFTYLLGRIAPGLLIGTVFTFVISFAFVYGGLEISMGILGFLPAAAPVQFLKYALNFSFFPIGKKNLALVSTLVWGVCYISVMAGIAAGYLLSPTGHPYSLEKIFTFVLIGNAAGSLVFREIEYGRTAGTWFGVFLLPAIISLGSINLERVADYGLLVYIICPSLVGLILWERASRLEFKDNANNNATDVIFLDTSQDFGPPPLSVLVTNLVIAVCIATLIGRLWYTIAAKETGVPGFLIVVTLIIFAWPAYRLWMQARASGLTQAKAILATLAQLALVGYPFRHYMGVKAGIPVRCGNCRQWRMVWMQDCPHCTTGNNADDKPRRRWMKSLDYDPHQCTFRVIFGITFLFFVLFFMTATIGHDPRYFYPYGTKQEPISSTTEAPQ